MGLLCLTWKIDVFALFDVDNCCVFALLGDVENC